MKAWLFIKKKKNLEVKKMRSSQNMDLEKGHKDKLDPTEVKFYSVKVTERRKSI